MNLNDVIDIRLEQLFSEIYSNIADENGLNYDIDRILAAVRLRLDILEQQTKKTI